MAITTQQANALIAINTLLNRANVEEFNRRPEPLRFHHSVDRYGKITFREASSLDAEEVS
jgi:ABC-type transport system involved in Fe-S cluster assembly fused permease/ATPase subunit